MTDFLLKIVTLSVVGSVSAGLLLLFRPLFKNRVGKAFAYYLWLVVLLRLCLPFGASLPAFWSAGTGQALSAAPAAVTPNTDPLSNSAGQSAGIQEAVQTHPKPAISASDELGVTSTDATGGGFQAALGLVLGWLKNPALWLMIWAAGAIACLGWHIRGYALFARAIRNTSDTPDEADFAIFQAFPEYKRVRYVRSPYVKTPMLIGLLHPTVVVPGDYAKNGLSERLRDIFCHELTHYRRHDLAYKWFTVFVTSLHWFNPLMLLIRREMARACELSCDEAVIRTFNAEQKQHYGETLLSLADSRPVPAGLLATTFCEERSRLKERLVSIMKYQAASRSAVLLSAVLLLGLAGCSAFSEVNKVANTAPVSASVSAQATASTAPADVMLTDATLYEKDGLTTAIPNEYASQLQVFPEAQWKDPDNTALISVFEKKSYDDCRADNAGNDSSYAGFIFSIVRYTQAQYEQFLCSDGSGQSFFAKDNTYYYGWIVPTDVQFLPLRRKNRSPIRRLEGLARAQRQVHRHPGRFYGCATI